MAQRKYTARHLAVKVARTCAENRCRDVAVLDLRGLSPVTDLHVATVIGDTVGDPFKDISSVAMNPVIKFTTLFGLLATEIAVTMKDETTKWIIGTVLFMVALVFIGRSFYGMRIPQEQGLKLEK